MDLKVSNTDNGSAGPQHLFQTNRIVAIAAVLERVPESKAIDPYSEILADRLLRAIRYPAHRGGTGASCLSPN